MGCIRPQDRYEKLREQLYEMRHNWLQDHSDRESQPNLCVAHDLFPDLIRFSPARICAHRLETAWAISVPRPRVSGQTVGGRRQQSSQIALPTCDSCLGASHFRGRDCRFGTALLSYLWGPHRQEGALKWKAHLQFAHHSSTNMGVAAPAQELSNTSYAVFVNMVDLVGSPAAQ